MTHLKRKLMMTLALLLTVATSAWAESKPIGLNVEYAAGDEITSTTDVYVYYGEELNTYRKMGVKITSTQPLTISMIHAHGFELNGAPAVYYLPDGDAEGGVAGGISCVGESTGDATVVHVASGSGTLTDPYVFALGPFGTPVDLTRGTGEKINEWTLTNGMPAGNVTVNVKYFPQAEFAKSTGETPEPLAPAAIPGVKATTDDPIVTPGTVANIGTSEVPQGTLMYYVSEEQLTDAQLVTLADQGKFSADVPKATDLTQGDVYVYYYIQGAEPASGERTDANTCSDGDILAANVVNVTLGAAPLWNAEFDLTNAPEEDKAPGVWSTDIPEGGVVKGTEVTVTYTGTKKIIGVKAEKIKVAEGHALTSAKLGEIVCSDGKAYAAADKDILPKGVKAEALVCYVVGNGRGLALALTDEGEMNWSTAQTTCTAHTPAITGGTWKLASQGEWNNMISAAGSYTALRDGFSSVGGTNMRSDRYWSSSGYDDDRAWIYNFYLGQWDEENKNYSWYVRACLAF